VSDEPTAVLPLEGGPSDTGPRYDPSSSTLDGEKVRRWTEFHEAAARVPDDLRAALVKASELTLWEEPRLAEVWDGKVALRFRMPRQSVSLLRLGW
jgi:hypothetical protein